LRQSLDAQADIRHEWDQLRAEREDRAAATEQRSYQEAEQVFQDILSEVPVTDRAALMETVNIVAEGHSQ
jgi:hypothetical protein